MCWNFSRLCNIIFYKCDTQWVVTGELISNLEPVMFTSSDPERGEENV